MNDQFNSCHLNFFIYCKLIYCDKIIAMSQFPHSAFKRSTVKGILKIPNKLKIYNSAFTFTIYSEAF